MESFQAFKKLYETRFSSDVRQEPRRSNDPINDSLPVVDLALRENGPTRPVRHHMPTEIRCGIAASSVAFRSVSESHGDLLPSVALLSLQSDIVFLPKRLATHGNSSGVASVYGRW
ncbi:hypothetical protein EVAR_90727_1 [Eumeta japonica]|uniref:Uncharacterized protein n=1 Tax=Eumeta variegata TaxID=151549 RepID=A0A4C1ZZY0_EUMVA|nr:hypothetical protein EVAR_90727_1 [Eumeta japonica]